MTQAKITHLTSVHARYDTRIFHKMCKSLSKEYEVYLIVADSNGNEIKDNIHIIDVGKPLNRKDRILNTTKKVFKKAKELDSDIYHFHDPELIFVGLKLKQLGKKVIFDIHENITLQIKDKDYLPRFLREIVARAYRFYEKISLKKFDYLILAEESYKNYYEHLSCDIEIILNMPDINPLKNFVSDNRNKNELFYIGGISNNRGLDVTIEAIKILIDKFPDIFMHYIGPYNQELLDKLDLNSVQNNIKFYGRLSLFDGLLYSKNAKVGLSILKPIGNYTKSYSTKVFEYMALGLPVITSDFQLYKDVVEKYNCGICVNPLEPKGIAEAIEYIFTHTSEAKQMGQNGKKAVVEKYNWGVEENKLFEIYKELTK